MRLTLLVVAALTSLAIAAPESSPESADALTERAVQNCPCGGPGMACPFGQFLVSLSMSPLLLRGPANIGDEEGLWTGVIR